MVSLTKPQKIYAGILGVALVCLIGDQLFLRPATVEAAEEPSGPLPPSDTPMPPINVPEPDDTTKRRFEMLAPDHDATTTRDVFARPLWAGGVVEDATCRHAAELADRTLKAVFAGTNARAIVNNGESLAIGDPLGAFHVTEINARQVILECTEHPGTRVTLKMSE